jgi:hypothetical protein
MAGKQPFFLTGANAKIKVNGVTLAYATNVSYRVEVIHEDPRILGMYEGHSLEPVSYRVSGNFSVIRYVADAKDRIPGSPSGANVAGNGAGYMSPDGSLLQKAAGVRPDSREFFDPKLMDRHAGFEIEIFQKMPSGDPLPVAKIKGAKLTLSEFSMDKKSPAIQNFAFRALYADEDSFKTRFSGRGQQFT